MRVAPGMFCSYYSRKAWREQILGVIKDTAVNNNRLTVTDKSTGPIGPARRYFVIVECIRHERAYLREGSAKSLFGLHKFGG